jgi:putative phosphoesterase
MKIGILSDTHKKEKKAKKAIEFLVKNGVQYLIHAGDIVKLEVLDMLEETGLPYKAVLGNNDYHLVDVMHKYNLYKEPHYFKIEDTSFKLMHIPFYMSADVDVVVYGHTHCYECKKPGKSLYLNSGEVCARDTGKSEIMILEITESEYKNTYYYRKSGEKEWISKEFKFERD